MIIRVTKLVFHGEKAHAGHLVRLGHCDVRSLARGEKMFPLVDRVYGPREATNYIRDIFTKDEEEKNFVNLLNNDAYTLKYERPIDASDTALTLEATVRPAINGSTRVAVRWTTSEDEAFYHWAITKKHPNAPFVPLYAAQGYDVLTWQKIFDDFPSKAQRSEIRGFIDGTPTNLRFLQYRIDPDAGKRTRFNTDYQLKTVGGKASAKWVLITPILSHATSNDSGLVDGLQGAFDTLNELGLQHRGATLENKVPPTTTRRRRSDKSVVFESVLKSNDNKLLLGNFGAISPGGGALSDFSSLKNKMKK